MSDYFNRYVGSYVSSIGRIFTKSSPSPADGAVKSAENAVVKYAHKLENIGFAHLPRQARFLIRLGGLSGLAAILMSAYGSHVFKRQQANSDLKELYYTAQYYHLMHSIALLGVPLVKRPLITGSLFMSGIILFCGTMYYHAMTEDPSLKVLTPFGGFCLIAGWLTIVV